MLKIGLRILRHSSSILVLNCIPKIYDSIIIMKVTNTDKRDNISRMHKRLGYYNESDKRHLVKHVSDEYNDADSKNWSGKIQELDTLLCTEIGYFFPI